MGRGLLGSVFNFVDPILDTIDPMHNKVQEWTTGSKETAKQSPYFETIFPMVIDGFFPGWGSAIGAADGASTGNWTKAGLSALGSYAGFAGAGSSAASGASEGLAATEGLQAADGLQATQASEGLLSTGGDYSSMYGTNTYGDGFDAASLSSTQAQPLNLGPSNNFGQTPSNEFGYQGLTSKVDSPYSTQFMTMPTSQFSSAAGVGGVGQGLEGTAEMAGAGSKVSSGLNYGKLAQTGGKMFMQQQQNAEQEAKQRAMMRQQSAQGAMNSANYDAPSRPAQSFQTLTPYAQFEGGYNPRKYGANVRKGLL